MDDRTPRTTRPIAVLDAPSNLGLRPLRPGHVPGVWRLPDALRATGLVERLGAVDTGRLHAPPYAAEPETSTTFRNGLLIASWSRLLAERVDVLLDGSFPVVLGGDCSILLGPTLALRRRGTYGLVFIDGHTDYCDPRDPAQRVAQTAAGRDLALVTGRGPAALTNIDGLAPYIRPEHAAIVGYGIEPSYAAAYDTAPFFASPLVREDADNVRRDGAAVIAQRALDTLVGRGVEQVWIHLDVDVLDQRFLPAVDSPNPIGIDIEQLRVLLITVLLSGRVVGMNLTIFDPELDPDGRYAKMLTDLLVDVLAS